VAVLRYDTLPHGFLNYVSLAEGAKSAFVEIAEHVRLAMGAEKV